MKVWAYIHSQLNMLSCAFLKEAVFQGSRNSGDVLRVGTTGVVNVFVYGIER
jgi:hypothetical protein